MQKLLITTCALLIGVSTIAAPHFGYGIKTRTDNVTSIDYYDVKATINTPTVALNKKSGVVYKDWSKQNLNGSVTLSWTTTEEVYTNFFGLVTHTNTYNWCDVSLSLSENGKDYVYYTMNKWSDMSSFGKKEKTGSVLFNAENTNVTETLKGYKFLTFSGKTATKDYSLVETICNACGITTEGSSKCRKVISASGNVVGVYSCGCGSESPSWETLTCGWDTTAVTPMCACYGSWKMKYNKTKSSETK